MVEYMVRLDLPDRKSLILHIQNKLSDTQVTLSENKTVIDESIVFQAPEAVDYMEDAILIEKEEFDKLTRADISLIAERVEVYRSELESILAQRGVNLIDSEIIFKLVNILTQGQKLRALEEMIEEEQNQYLDKKRKEAFELAKQIIKDHNFSEKLENISTKNLDVWTLLVNLSEINEILEEAGRDEGITLIANDPELLKKIVPPQAEITSSENDADSTKITPAEAVLIETKEANNSLSEKDILYSAPFKPESPVTNGNKQMSPLEKREPNIRAEINSLLDEILLNTIFNKPVSAIQLNRIYNSMKQSVIDKAVEHRLISFTSGNHGYPYFDASAVCALLYLRDHGNLPSRLQKQVQDIAEEELQRRQKRKKAK